MVQLYDDQSGDLIGTITEEQLKYLIDQLEEEDLEDRNYYIDRTTLEWFEEHAVDPVLEAMLRQAMGDRDGMDIRWKRA
ncbi:MAG: galactosyldiacylglycerol synthase [Anaerolineae bacterium]